MTRKSQLLAAASLAGLFAATPAHALPDYPAAEIRGNGASAIANVMTKTLNCLGGPNNDVGFSATGTTQNLTEHYYRPVSPTASNPIFNCGITPPPADAGNPLAAERSVQPNIDGKYISSGSSRGVNNFVGFTASNIQINPFGAWTNVQYAASEAPLSSANITTYNTNARPVAGAPIQIPFFVVPIALAYNPVYGKAADGTEYTFNVKSTYVQKVTINTVPTPVGGLRLKKATYCKILNGVITNWNDAALTADNGGQSLRDPDDDLARWNVDGVPIKLIARNDGSGSTNLFTRHLDALGNVGGTPVIADCATGPGGSPAQLDDNDGGTDTIPVAARNTALYDKTTGALTGGTHTLGKFGRVDGSDGIVAVIGRALPTPVSGVELGGFFGYVGADWVYPATIGTTTPVVFSAALQEGAPTSTIYKMPNAANATAAFGTTFVPPQSNLNGTYNSTVAGDRTDPLQWVLPAAATDRLANPAKGYPITGTSNLMLYTCYSTPAKRLAIHALAALGFGKITKDNTSTGRVPAQLYSSTGKGSDGLQLGILPRNGLAFLPPAWKTAIWETFFQKITKAAPNNPATIGGVNGLYIQDKLPTANNQIDGTDVGGVDVKGNASCAGLAGA